MIGVIVQFQKWATDDKSDLSSFKKWAAVEKCNSTLLWNWPEKVGDKKCRSTFLKVLAGKQ
jgi:hypothetical protein